MTPRHRGLWFSRRWIALFLPSSPRRHALQGLQQAYLCFTVYKNSGAMSESKMAVTIQYVVVRDGVEKMTFASKKEADSYDKMLDLADNLSEWLALSPVALAEETREALGFYLAEQKEALSRLLRGASLASLQQHAVDNDGECVTDEGAEEHSRAA